MIVLNYGSGEKIETIEFVKERMIKDIGNSFDGDRYSILYCSFNRDDFPSSYDGYIFKEEAILHPGDSVPESEKEEIHLFLYYALCRKEASSTAERITNVYSKYTRERDVVEHSAGTPVLESPKVTPFNKKLSVVKLISKSLYILSIGLVLLGYLFPAQSAIPAVLALAAMIPASIVWILGSLINIDDYEDGAERAIKIGTVFSVISLIVGGFYFCVLARSAYIGFKYPSTSTFSVTKTLIIFGSYILVDLILFFVELLLEIHDGDYGDAIKSNRTRKEDYEEACVKYYLTLAEYEEDLKNNKSEYEKISKAFEALSSLYCVRVDEIEKEG